MGGALFLSLYSLNQQNNTNNNNNNNNTNNDNVFLLPTGLNSNFLVVSDATAAKSILRGYPRFQKGLVREVSEFLFGDGFAVAEGENWKQSRRRMLPSLHKVMSETNKQTNFVSQQATTLTVYSSNNNNNTNNNHNKNNNELASFYFHYYFY